MRKTMKRTLISFLLLCAVPLAAFSSGASQVEDLFWSRQWTALESTLNAPDYESSSRDRVMYANSLWLQGKWAPAMEIFLEERNSLPDKLRPYADMLIALGFERTGSPQKAREVAMSLWSIEEWFLSPYVAYALGRIALGEGNVPEARGWFRAMYERAADTSLRRQALESLIRLPDPDPRDGISLLEIAPFHKGALALVRQDPGVDDDTTAFPLGYAAFFSGDHEEAVLHFRRVSPDSPNAERARFFMARSLSRLGRGDEALDLWGELALTSSRYFQSSVESISRMAAESGGKAMEMLNGIALSGPEDPAAAALAELANLFARKNDEERALVFEDMLLEKYPKSRFAGAALWEKGWSAWKHGDVRAADAAWTRALEAGNDRRQETRLLYWAARANERLGDSRTASALLERLRNNFPIDYYTFLAFPEGGVRVDDNVPKVLAGEEGELADWGFVIYARMEMASSDRPAGRFASARLAMWLGDARGAFVDALPLFSMLSSFTPLPRPVLEVLYPKAREREVLEASSRFGVDPLDVWAIMRRESAFDEEAVSTAGAMGLMQLMPPTARENAAMLGLKEGDYFDPSRNIILGTHHFSRLLKMFDRIEWSIAAYNAGQGAVGRWLPPKGPVEEWIEDIPYGETREFVRQVMANRNIYRITYPDIAANVKDPEDAE